VLRDAINNVIEVVRFGEFSLIYNRPLTDAGLTWGELVAWWKEENRLNDRIDMEVARNLYERLFNHSAARSRGFYSEPTARGTVVMTVLRDRLYSRRYICTTIR
jgi:hypothetical protein